MTGGAVPVLRHHGSPSLVAAAASALRPLDAVGTLLKLGWRLVAIAAASVLLTRAVLAALEVPSIARTVSSALKRAAASTAGLSKRADARLERLLQAKATPKPTASAAAPAAASPPPSKPASPWAPSKASASSSATPSSSATEADLVTEVGKMRIKQIKAELDALGVPHADAIEKSDLVERLVSARQRPAASSPPPAAAPAATPVAAEVVTGGTDASMPFGDINELGDIPDGMLPDGVSKEEAFGAMNDLMNNPKGMQLLMEMQSNPKVMQAAMEMSTGGEAAAAKYANDPQVMGYMKRLEELMGPM